MWQLQMSWVSVWALRTSDVAILEFFNTLNLIRGFVFFCTGITVSLFSSVSVYSVPGLQTKLRDGPLHNEKARGFFFDPDGLLGSLLTGE